MNKINRGSQALLALLVTVVIFQVTEDISHILRGRGKYGEMHVLLHVSISAVFIGKAAEN